MHLLRNIILIDWNRAASEEELEVWLKLCDQLSENETVYNYCRSVQRQESSSSHDLVICFDTRPDELWSGPENPFVTVVKEFGKGLIDQDRLAWITMPVHAESPSLGGTPQTPDSNDGGPSFVSEVHRRGINTGMPTDWTPPPDLLRVPGIERNEYEERFYAREYPLKSWFLSVPEYVQHFFQVGISDLMTLYGEALRKGKELCTASAQVAPESNISQKEPDLTDFIRQEAFNLGFTMVGFRPYDSKYAYAETRDNITIKKNVIALGLEQPYGPTQTTPSKESELAVFGTYVKIVELCLQLAESIRGKGYRAEVFHPVDASTPMVIHPYFVEAGLGQMGANGQLLSPYSGSRARLTVIGTDAPVRFDEPIDYGLPKFCSKCQVCVQRCPGRALTQREINWRGVRKFKTITNRCAPMTSTFDGCGVCMAVCPIQKYGYQKVMDHYRNSGTVLGKGSSELEGYSLKGKGYFGPGQMPSFTREEIIAPGIDLRYGDPLPDKAD
jgi:epoxyqueuosine reductase